MDLQAFLMENTRPPREMTLPLSERFLDSDGQRAPFVLRGISEEQNAALRAACQRPQGDGQPHLDRERYLKKLAAACVFSPDLESAQLQQSWGVLGAEALLCKMLTAGEFARLLAAAEEVCGFGRLEEKKDALKKASAGETAS